MKASFLLFLLSICSVSIINAQCPNKKTIHSYTYTNTSSSKNNGEISLEVNLNKDISFVVLDMINDNVVYPTIVSKKTNSVTTASISGLASGEYRIDVYSKGCPYTSKLSIGNPNIIIK